MVLVMNFASAQGKFIKLIGMTRPEVEKAMKKDTLPGEVVKNSRGEMKIKGINGKDLDYTVSIYYEERDSWFCGECNDVVELVILRIENVSRKDFIEYQNWETIFGAVLAKQFDDNATWYNHYNNTKDRTRISAFYDGANNWFSLSSSLGQY